MKSKSESKTGARGGAGRFWGALLFAGTLGCAQEIVAHQQAEREANAILVHLREAGISAEKLQDTESRDMVFNVVVAKREAPKAYSVLHEKNLPKERARGTGELFGEAGLIPTSEQERAKREAGVMGDLANALRDLPRVVDVKVSVSIPPERAIPDPTVPAPRPKAAVIVIFQPDPDGRAPFTVDNVQSFVQASLPELKAAEVGVQLIPNTGAPMMMDDSAAAVARGLPEDKACLKTTAFWIEICQSDRKPFYNLMVGTLALALVLATLAVVAILRALNYRKDLTRLTAQVQQVRP